MKVTITTVLDLPTKESKEHYFYETLAIAWKGNHDVIKSVRRLQNEGGQHSVTTQNMYGGTATTKWEVEP